MNFYMPTRLYTGTNCLAEHADELRALGTSCLVVTGKNSAQASGALGDIEQALNAGDVFFHAWDGVTENPPLEACSEAGRVASELGADFVVGVGGGSALDAAKAIAVFAANPTLDESKFYAKVWDNAPLPIVLVGTTAGTGSEVTKVSVLTDSIGRKHSIHDDLLFAKLAFGDSRYTHSCSPTTTLSAGIDILAHSAESYFSNKADEISRAFAARAIRLFLKPFRAAVAGETLSAVQRSELYEASILGGLAINTTGTCFPHNVGYYLTEHYGVPHGFACAIFLPEMLARAREFDVTYSDAFFDEIGTSEAELVALVDQALPDFGISMSEDEIDAELPRWDNNGSVINTRADISVDTVREILVGMFKY